MSRPRPARTRSTIRSLFSGLSSRVHLYERKRPLGAPFGLTRKNWMPWQNQGGSGWPGGGKGPWGQGPNGSGGRGPRTPPDLEDLIQRVQDQFKSALPGGGGGRMSWLLPLLLIFAIWLYNSVYVVSPEQQGVVLNFGKYSRT